MYRMGGYVNRVNGTNFINARTDLRLKLGSSPRGVTSRQESVEPSKNRHHKFTTSDGQKLGSPDNENSDQEVVVDRIQLSTSGVSLKDYDKLLKVLEVHQTRLKLEFGLSSMNMSDITFTIPSSLKIDEREMPKGVSGDGTTTLSVVGPKGLSSTPYAPAILDGTLEPEQYSIELDELDEDGYGIYAETQETVNSKFKETSKMKVSEKDKHKSASSPADCHARNLQYQSQVLHSLKSFVEASVLSGELSQAIATLHYYRRKLELKLGKGGHHPIPTGVYNSLLSGYANTGNFSGAMMIRRIMADCGVPFDSSTFSYLLAVSKDRDAKFISKIISMMFEKKITFEQLFQKTVFTKVQRENAIKAIRKVQADFEVPAKTFPMKYTCDLLQHLNQRGIVRPSPNEAKNFSLKRMADGAREQWNRELNMLVKIRSVVASKEPTPYVKFLRGQVAALEEKWSDDIRQAFNRELRNLENHKKLKSGMTLYPYLRALDPKATVTLLLHEIRTMALSSETYSPSMNQLSDQLGQRMNDLYVISAKTKYGITPKLQAIYDSYLEAYDSEKSCPDREIWQDLLSRHSLWGPTVEELSPAQWPRSITIGVGRFLYQVLRNLQIDINILKSDAKPAVMVNAIYTIYRDHQNHTGKKEEAKPHPTLAKLYREAQLEHLYFDVKMIPMLCPPRPWCNPVDSPLLLSQVPFIRLPYEGSSQRELVEKAPREDLFPSFDALNVLSKCPWIINKPMLQLVTEVFLNNGNPKLDIPQPPTVIQMPPSINSVLKQDKYKSIRELALYHRKCAEAYSLWCDMLYKLSIANHFKDNIFWFPHNMDFRGRVYPCPPHFSHIGSDVMRGCLMFAEGKPLGPKGLNWLKLHLVNLTGFLKRQSVADRLKYAEEITSDILDSADHPFTGRKWWQKSDEPWQTLAACKEVANALRCGKGPSEYVCHFPVHQDGSCNGLQHYAALGRDLQGAEQVNLRPMNLPQDVYSGIAEVVERQRKQDADSGVLIAQILEGHIKRKVVKQTVMTVVYGVTKYGAQLQILRQLQDLDDFPQQHAHIAASYLVQKVFFSLREMFTATREIQDWFTNCAKLVAKIRCRPINWVTPLGLPVVQPYFVPVKKTSLVSFGESIKKQYIDLGDHDAKPNVNKQKNAFPPNFVHSLDSSHMMLTAIHAQAAGITFVSVHDCFWTHPSTVDIMNQLCREQFVALHSYPILEDLSIHLQKQFGFPTAEILKDSSVSDIIKQRLNKVLRQVPQKGEFDLKEVLDSVYFFG
ncbi:DNA-directed RNA polymerase, mitochondrial-like isoform X2 [Varroa destructor]|nr:DNA-directed RNA polymerase, mitochondrial-like isoform X2 [Varroa destructor]XP_022665631.1 DNA-directed RNA polymerase, mitochondrial-like isoform X2 [Varroa destructor]